MITKAQLNDDQQVSFNQMTMEGGVNEGKALELIQEFCIDKGFTGLKAFAFDLTPKGMITGLNLLPELPAVGLHTVAGPHSSN